MTAPTALDVFACPLDGIALIEASAGTGKTWNICALYLRQLLENGREVSEVLVMTFTRAATAELAARIRARLGDVLRACEGGEAAAGDDFVAKLLAAARRAGVSEADVRTRLERALAMFDEAAIFTIHGFCQRALAETPFAAGLPFEVEVAEDDGDVLLEATRDFWRREVATVSPELADHLLDKDDSPERWTQWLKDAQARPLAEVRWDDEAPDAEGNGEALTDALASAYAAARDAWGDGSAPLAALRDAQPGLNKSTYKAEAIDTAFTQWSAWFAANDARLPHGRKYRLDLFSAARLEARTNKGRTPPAHPFFTAAQTLLEVRTAFTAALDASRLALLRRYVETVGAEARRRKREERRASFDDLLWNAHEALEAHPRLAALLHARYPAALVDEFQDTDPLQWAIFSRLYDDAESGRHGSLFLVGDPKQAIYSFRGADLYTYLAARARADAHYTLAVNHRSVATLVRACNDLFAANPRVFMEPGLTFSPVTSHAAATADERPALRLWRIPEGGVGGVRLLRAQALERTAAASATEIVRLIDAGESSGEIAVLVRSHRQAARMKAALSARGVSSVEMSQESVFASAEARDLESVLRAIAEPGRERLVKTALATALMGRDAAALEALARDDDGLAREFDRFALWHEVWLQSGFAVMLWRWMADDGVAARLLVCADGERRLTNLFHLAELLQSEAGRAAPAALLRGLVRRRTGVERGGDDALLRLESDRDLVRIVTVHRAKGLQYGIVFCPFLFDGYVLPDGGGPMRLWHEADGRQVADWRAGAADDLGIKGRLALERAAEDLRLIYVALTRAKRRCYLTVGAYAKPGRNSVSHTEGVRALLNWMVAGAGMDAAAWGEVDLTPDEIDARWRALAAASDGATVLEDLPVGTSATLETRDTTPHYAAPAPPVVPSGWRFGSYSGIVSGAAHEDAALDHDARVDQPPPETVPVEPVPADDILRFPRGATAGDCIHAMFEAIDFTRSESRAPAIAAALAAHPLPGEAATHARMLTRLAADVLATPLVAADDSLRLETVPVTRRISELGFYLPAPRLTTGALAGLLAGAGYDMPRLRPADFSGYLKGFIDLVFEHDGRYYVLDWKSNHLGDAPADYGPARVAAAMRQHGYHLQHLLYTVALHRHLRRTLPGYDYARHVGGTLYLFVRGVRPDWRVDGVPAGVFHHRAAPEFVAALDALLAGEGR